MEINKDNIATYGLRTWEQTGTIAFDFANYLEKLPTLKGTDLDQFLNDGWFQVGFCFGKSLINKTDTLNLDIVLCKKGKGDEVHYGYLRRTVDKEAFLNLIVNFTAYAANQVEFENDNISFRQLTNLEE